MQQTNIRENIQHFADQEKMTVQGLSESITHVLAGLSQTAGSMHPNSIAALLAGVEKLSTDLPKSEDPAKKQNTIRVLAAAAMNHNKLSNESLPNHSVVVIAQHGSKFPDLVQKYARIAANPDQLNKAAKQLSYGIEQAMNSTATLKMDPAAAGSTPPPSSSTPNTAGVPNQAA